MISHIGDPPPPSHTFSHLVNPPPPLPCDITHLTGKIHFLFFYFTNLQGDLCNSDQCFLGISPKLVEVQSSIIVQKKRNSIVFYLVPGIRQSVQQFSHNTPKPKSGAYLKIDISVSIFSLMHRVVLCP